MQTGHKFFFCIAVLTVFALTTIPGFSQTTYTWIALDSSWHVASNWSPAGIPGPGDNAVINSGKARIHSDVEIENITFTQGTITGEAVLTVTGQMDWSAGTLSGSGSTKINAGASLIISGDNHKDLDARTLVNEGVVSWSGDGEIKLHHSAVIQNQAGALFEVQNNERMDYVLEDSGGSFINAGTLTKSAGDDETQIDPVFTNTGAGVVNANSGILRFERGDTTVSSGGNFNVTSGNYLVLAERTFIFDGATFNGDGTVQIFDVEVTTGAGVIVEVTGAGILINSGVNMELDESRAMFKGDGPVIVDGKFTLKRGTITGSGAFTVNGSFDLGGGNTKNISGRTIDIAGALYQTGAGPLNLSNNALLSLESGSIFDFQADASINFVGPDGGSIVNAGAVTKSAGSGTSSINVDFTNSGSLNVNSGTVQFSRGSSHTATTLAMETGAFLNFSGGTHLLDGITLDGSGAAQITKDSVMVNGTGLTVSPAVTLTLSAGALTGNGDITIDGTMNWSGGTISGSGAFTTNHILNLSSGTNKTLKGRTITNTGSANWIDNGDLLFGDNCVFLNQNGALFDIRNNATIKFTIPSGGVLNNAGALTKSAGISTSEFDVALANSGTINVNSGDMKFLNGSAHSGATLNCASGALLELKGDSHSLEDVTVSGSGTVKITDASAALAGGGITVNPGAILLMSGSSCLLYGNSPVTVDGTFNWTGGAISGVSAFTLNGYLNTSGGSSKTIDGFTLTNNGIITITGAGALRLGDNAVLSNPTGGLIDIQSDAAIAFREPDGGALVNAGTLTKSGGVSGSITVPLQNSGIVNVNSGTLRLSRGSSAGNTVYNLSGGGILEFYQNTHSLDNVAFSGNGTAQINRAAMNISGGGITVDNGVTLGMDGSDGSISGNGAVTVNGTFAWNRGIISGSEVFALNNACTIGSANSKTLDGRTMINSGNIIVNGAGTVGLKNNAHFVNQAGGIVSLQADGVISFLTPGGGIFDNAGLVTKEGGVAASTIGVDFHNTGALQAEAGTLAFTRALLNDTTGTIGGSATLNISLATFTNYGGFYPGSSPGTLIINGNYSQTDTASLNIELGGTAAGSEYDRLLVFGSSQLDGALNISLVNGFAPEIGDQFEVLFSSTARSGKFSQVSYPDAGIGKGFDTTYTANGLLLEVIAAGTQANLKTWLEGPYHVAGFMETTLKSNDLLPLNQPYNGAPWNYPGTESVSNIPDGIVDWVLVELRSDVAAASSVAARAGWINSDGMLVDLDGATPLTFKAPGGNYYVVVRHRNHLGIMSASALPLGEVSALYDFTTAQSQAYGSNPMKQLEEGVYGMIAGDGNADGSVNISDRELVWRPQNGTAWNYQKRGDFNLDGGVDAGDLNYFWRGNDGAATQVPSGGSLKSANNRSPKRSQQKRIYPGKAGEEDRNTSRVSTENR